jgi:hypothetical protein
MTKSQKALDLFNLLRAARDETLSAIFEAKAKLDVATAIYDRVAAFAGCGDGKGNNDAEHASEWAMERLADERMDADHVLDAAISEMVERNAAMWEAARRVSSAL